MDIISPQSASPECPAKSCVLDHSVPLFQQLPGQNDCGPHAVAMAIGYFHPGRIDPEGIAQQIRLLRVPFLGATLPWGITSGLRRNGTRPESGWFGRISTIKREIEAGHPVIVIVKPSDFRGCQWYVLHYRVVVGYCDDLALAGGGELYFNCSASPPRGEAAAERGNLTIDYATFVGQWRTYLTPNWWAAAAAL